MAWLVVNNWLWIIAIAIAMLNGHDNDFSFMKRNQSWSGALPQPFTNNQKDSRIECKGIHIKTTRCNIYIKLYYVGVSHCFQRLPSKQLESIRTIQVQLRNYQASWPCSVTERWFISRGLFSCRRQPVSRKPSQLGRLGVYQLLIPQLHLSSAMIYHQLES